jgi:hypothetical protein
LNASLDYDASTVTSEASWGRREASLASLAKSALLKVQVPPSASGRTIHFGFLLRLAIELDGGGHNEPAKKGRDAERTAFLNKEGIEVVRFWNHMVLREIDGVLGTIDVALQKRSKEAHP